MRAAILGRINCHCHGHSGLRLVVTETLAELLNKGVTPVMCEKGSVGACGDLSPMAQMALVPMGEGEAFYKGERLPGAEALKRAGIKRLNISLDTLSREKFREIARRDALRCHPDHVRRRRGPGRGPPGNPPLPLAQPEERPGEG